MCVRCLVCQVFLKAFDDRQRFWEITWWIFKIIAALVFLRQGFEQQWEVGLGSRILPHSTQYGTSLVRPRWANAATEVVMPRFRHRCRLSFHGPRHDISRSKMYAHNEVLCTSCQRHEFTFRVLQRWLTKASRVHQGWIGSCWIRSGNHCRLHCLRKGLWQICEGLDEALLLSLLLLHLLQRVM